MDIKEVLFKLSSLDSVGAVHDAADYAAEELKKYVPEADMRADAEVSKAIQFVRDNAEITAVEAKAEEPAEE